jgi:L-threonylcarbamoyladenylate synthase
MKNVVQVDPQSPQRDVIERAAAVLRAGGLVAFPTETVYGLGAHALDPIAVRKIFAAKQRPGWDPLIVHVRDLAMAQTLASRTPPLFEELAAQFWPGPLTLVVGRARLPRERGVAPNGGSRPGAPTPLVPDEVTAGRETVAVRMPRHPVAAALLAAAGLPIAAPSANRFGRPSPTRAEHVVADLGDRVDLILNGGPTPMGVESTVLDLTQSPPAILRPGGVSREELEKVLGKISLASSVSDERAGKGLRGPGMATKHYAPRATVEVFENAESQAARADELRHASKRIGIVDTSGDAQRLARTLFAQLRDLDAQGVDVILCVLPAPEGVGLAVRDRLLRAAGIVAAKPFRGGADTRE